KVRKLYNGGIVAGFAGAAADAFTLFARFEAKLDEHRGNLPRAAVELAKDWRTDRVLRRLEALLAVADREHSFIVSGTGDVIEPDDGLIGIRSGRASALAAARALTVHSDLDAKAIATEAMPIAAAACIYTNGPIRVDALSRRPRATADRRLSRAYSAGPQGRGVEVHRGRLRRARRRVDDPRPDRAVGEHRQGREDGERVFFFFFGRGGAAARRPAAAPFAGAVLERVAGGDRTGRLAGNDEGEAPWPAPRRAARRAPRRAGNPAALPAHDRGPLRPGYGGDGHPSQRHAVELHAGQDEAAPGPCRRGAAAPRAGGGPEARRHGRGGHPG